VGFLDRVRGVRGEAMEMTVAADSEMLIGAPSQPPLEDLVVALRDSAARHPEVRSAYLFQKMILADGEEPHLTLGLVLDDGGDVTGISNDLGGRAMEVLPQGSNLDVYPLPDDMAVVVAESVQPFYERGRD
jgi:SseB protein C-terminal domain